MSNTMEIERKYLVDPVLWKKAVEENHYRFKSDVIQAHVKQDEPGVQTLRVAIVNGKKAKVSFKGVRTGASRKEIEFKIDLKDAYDLHNMIEHKCHKHRYIAMHDGNEWEVDVMQGDNEGLIIAELEIPSEDYKFKKPEWVAQEVTDDPRFYQTYLAFNPYKDWDDKPEIIHEKKDTHFVIPDGPLGELIRVTNDENSTPEMIKAAVEKYAATIEAETCIPKVTTEDVKPEETKAVEEATEPVTDSVSDTVKEEKTNEIKDALDKEPQNLKCDFNKLMELNRSTKSDYARLYETFGRLIEYRELPYHISCASTYSYIKRTLDNNPSERVGDPNPPMLFINSDYCDVLGEGWFTDSFGTINSEYKLNILCGVNNAIVKAGTKVPVVASKYIPKGFTYSAENREKGSALIEKYLYPNAEKKPEEITHELVALESAVPKNL